MSKKKQSKLKKVMITLFLVIVISLFFLIYFVPNIGDTFQKTRVVTYDSIQIMDHIECYIIRDETVAFSSVEGAIHYNISEGERVRKGTEILRVDMQKIDPSAENKLEVINQRIERINNGESIFENDIKKIEALIQMNIDEIRKSKDKGNLSQVRRIEEKIKRLIDKKNIILSNTGLKDNSMEALKQEKGQIENMLNQSVISYITGDSGRISYYIDGYESVFTPANMYLLNKDELENMDMTGQNTARVKTLPNEPLYKIICSSTWYIAAWVDENKADKYIKGNTVFFNFPNGQTKGYIYDIIKEDDGNLVLIEIDHYYPEYWKLRRIDTDIIVANYEGIKIDNDSIVEVEGQTGVFIVDINGNYVFRPVKIIGSDDKKTIVESGYYYVETEKGLEKVKTIDLYDEVLRNAKGKANDLQE